MDFKNKATKIRLSSLGTVPMRTFHMTWSRILPVLLRLARNRAADGSRS